MIDIVGNIESVRARIAQAEAAAGREIGTVKLMLAAKYQPIENLITAMQAGARFFGHNLVPQLVAAECGLQQSAQNALNFGIGTSGSLDFSHTTTVIGHVQSNKLRHAMQYAQRIDTVDTFKLAAQINRRQAARISAGEVTTQSQYPILLQVNSSGALTQHGCNPAQLLELAHQICKLPHVQIAGLMTIGANSADPQLVAQSFACVHELSRELQQIPECANAKTLSMGMTGDLELAIAHGSTEVRIGTAIFGARPMK
ncbi:YggS family pyridoxal phosphate-dependent enzyme [Arcanobacterium hippocoleae]|uniref:Pyridoxal phosphate homeostasis protein n=1 Tax=Arcanobacterium hippocoleae TaxID=149017 RepID=A0ABU1T1E7_9ACTO|nr:YggS family pyridoxal phosphate-dependent enzyme [Arcanobacterium hippocoleae]MDR6939183.1 pyridoxal phosphate enzyme (YggS family) [Arcanobacterium hippocoleae]